MVTHYFRVVILVLWLSSTTAVTFRSVCIVLIFGTPPRNQHYLRKKKKKKKKKKKNWFETPGVFLLTIPRNAGLRECGISWIFHYENTPIQIQ